MTFFAVNNRVDEKAKSSASCDNFPVKCFFPSLFLFIDIWYQVPFFACVIYADRK